MKNVMLAGVMVLVGCGGSGGKDPVASNSATSPSSASSSASGPKKSGALGSSSNASAPTAPPEPPKRERIKMYNSCNKPVRLYFKRNGSDLQTSLNTSTHTEERATDGDVIQLMDDSGHKEVDKITITPQMNEVVIASGCVKFEAK